MFGLNHIDTGPAGLHPADGSTGDSRFSRISLVINGDVERIIHIGIGPPQPLEAQSLFPCVQVAPFIVLAQHPPFSAHRRSILLQINGDEHTPLVVGAENDHLIHVITVIGTTVLIRCDGDVFGPFEDERRIQMGGSRSQPGELLSTAIHPDPPGQSQGGRPKEK